MMGNQAGLSDSDSVLAIGSDRQLFVDDMLMHEREGLDFRLHEPASGETVFTFDREWEGTESWSLDILRSDGLFRMWYRAAEKEREQFTCYAESRDGIQWERPNLGIQEFQGSTENNIAIVDPNVIHPGVFLDGNSQSPVEERFKAVGGGTIVKKRPSQQEGTARELFGLVSPDGIRWKPANG